MKHEYRIRRYREDATCIYCIEEYVRGWFGWHWKVISDFYSSPERAREVLKDLNP